MANFGKAHEFTAKWEGGISDHPADRGGYTAYGVSEVFLRSLFGTASGRALLESYGLRRDFEKKDMKKIVTADVAASVFRFEFWDGQGLDLWESQELATVYYDMSVNHGKKGACRMLQQALNNACQAGLRVDGALGPKTRAAVTRAAAHARQACRELLRLREVFFKNLAARSPSQKVFLKGWLNRTSDLGKYVGCQEG